MRLKLSQVSNLKKNSLLLFLHYKTYNCLTWLTIYHKYEHYGCCSKKTETLHNTN